MSQNRANIITDGNHTEDVISVLSRDIADHTALDAIKGKAAQIIERSVDPVAGPPPTPSDGLLYGLIQSGKTSVITVAAAMAADNGFSCVVILTSDIDLLYDQTLERVRQALRGMKVLGKNDWRDPDRFNRLIRQPPIAIVCSKNSSKLASLLEAFKRAGARGISALIIDDEADQASLNTNTSKSGAQASPINATIEEFRNFFRTNTYLQVTATPQALFLQRPDHRFRPSFTVLSQPGPGYHGGEMFFGEDSRLLRLVDINEVAQLQAGHQPAPNIHMPDGLRRALLSFLVGASAKVMELPGSGYAFLCHVSVRKADHEHLVRLIERFLEKTLQTLGNKETVEYDRLIGEIREAYEDLSTTEIGIPQFESILTTISRYLNGASVRLINASSSEEIQVDAVYNIFVGGNKLGRGVTIKNLIVSYYGRNPQKPNADTVLQHARMYGYRERTIGVTRLFLPERLADHFRLIHQMERALRNLVEKYPDGNFEGVYIHNPLHATRTNVLDPASIGLYAGGGYCNPSYPLRTSDVLLKTAQIDTLVSGFNANVCSMISLNTVKEIVALCDADPNKPIFLWNHRTIEGILEKIKTLNGEDAYLVISRDRDLKAARNETQGFLSGGEEALAPKDRLTLFLYKLKAGEQGVETWWPLIRWPEGNYVVAFSF